MDIRPSTNRCWVKSESFGLRYEMDTRVDGVFTTIMLCLRDDGEVTCSVDSRVIPKLQSLVVGDRGGV